MWAGCGLVVDPAGLNDAALPLQVLAVTVTTQIGCCWHHRVYGGWQRLMQDRRCSIVHDWAQFNQQDLRRCPAPERGHSGHRRGQDGPHGSGRRRGRGGHPATRARMQRPMTPQGHCCSAVLESPTPTSLPRGGGGCAHGLPSAVVQVDLPPSPEPERPPVPGGSGRGPQARNAGRPESCASRSSSTATPLGPGPARQASAASASYPCPATPEG